MTAHGVSIDLEAVGVFSRHGNLLAETIHDLSRPVAALRAEVKTQSRGKGPTESGVEIVRRLADRVLENSSSAAALITTVLAADVPALATPGVGSTATNEMAEELLDDLRHLETEGNWLDRVLLPWRLQRSGPWHDSNSDSWVVNLVRLISGEPPTQAAVERFFRSGHELREVGEVVLDASVELHPLTLLYRWVTDREQAEANIGSVVDGASDWAVGTGVLAAGLVGLVVPPVAAKVEEHTGTNPSSDLLEGLEALVLGLATDPDSTVPNMVGWDLLQEDPHYWLGNVVPDLAIGGKGTSTGLRALRGSRVARLLDGVLPPYLSRKLFPPVKGQAWWDELAQNQRHQYQSLEELRQLEGLWGDAVEAQTTRQRAFEPPEQWLGEINRPGPEYPGRSANCLDCARATEANWRGQTETAAPVRPEHGDGVEIEYLENWVGGEFRAMSLDAVKQRLDELGPGSSAMLHAVWPDGSGHAYNMVHDIDGIKVLDGQWNLRESYPPQMPERHVDRVIFIDPNGEVVQW